jgi:hypothetical protein
VTAPSLIVGLGAVLVVGSMLASRADGQQSRRSTETSSRASAPGLTYMGNSIGRAVATDGKRYAAYLVADGTARVLDTHGRTFKDFAVPPDPHPRLRTVAAVGGGYIMLGDSVTVVPHPKLVEITTGKVVDVDARPWAIRWDGVSLIGAGRHWISGDAVASHGGVGAFLNWRTGGVAADLPTYYEPRNTARATPDLNRAELWRPMCRPLRRRSSHDPKTGEGSGVWRRYQYRPPLGLTTSPTGRLLLERCGRRKVTTLSRCRKGCGFAQLGAGVVTWQAGRRGHFYRARTRCRRSWKIPAPSSHVAAAAHTSKRVFISTIDPRSYGQLQPRPTWAIYTAALPSC